MFKPTYFRNLIKLGRYRNPIFTSNNIRQLCDKQDKFVEDREKTKKGIALGDMGRKYQVFDDKNSEEILDVYEERLKYTNMLEVEEDIDPFEGLNLERGVSGVFEIEDLVRVLKQENAQDIFVTKVSKEHKYVDYMCIVSGKSQKHMKAIVQFVRRVYKHKMHKGDLIPRIEGENSKDWMALDLGNIALHVFSKEARKMYDLDLLWAVGPQYDDEFNKPEPVSQMLEKHSIYLKDLEPAG